MCRVGVLQRCGTWAIHTTGVSLGCLSWKAGMRAVPTSRNEVGAGRLGAWPRVCMRHAVEARGWPCCHRGACLSPPTDPGAWVPWGVPRGRAAPVAGTFPGRGKKGASCLAWAPQARVAPAGGASTAPCSGSLVSPEQPPVVGRGPGPPHVPPHRHRLADALPAAADGHHAHPRLPAVHLQQHRGTAGESPPTLPPGPGRPCLLSTHPVQGRGHTHVS